MRGCFFWRNFLHNLKSVQAENKDKKEKLHAFSHRLGVLAGRARLKQVDIARTLGVSSQRVGQWFQGRNFPGGDVEHALAEMLGVNRSWLLEGIETTELGGPAHEQSAHYGTVPIIQLRKEIRDSIERLLEIAGDDLARLGWIVEQLRSHLRVPDRWEASTIHAEVIAEVLAEEKREQQVAKLTPKTRYSDGAASGR